MPHIVQHIERPIKRGESLGESWMEQDLGVLVEDRLSNGMQSEAAANMASRILASIQKGYLL